MASLFLLILAAVLIHPSVAADNNVLRTGETLYPDQQLSYDESTLIMQGDCNLVLYGPRGFQSNTHGNGDNCTLSFTDNGRLIIRRADGSTVWSTPNRNSEKGNYAAVLRPDGALVIYGPEVWSTPALVEQPRRSLQNVPLVSNLLFSGQIMYGNAKLTSRDYSLVMKEDCNLALMKGAKQMTWQSETAGNGLDCFLRLDHQGRIAVVDDELATVWSSKPTSKTGEYVLVLQKNGQAVIYGPIVWSTAPVIHADHGRIAQVTME